jgi:hypothetical protein
VLSLSIPFWSQTTKTPNYNVATGSKPTKQINLPLLLSRTVGAPLLRAGHHEVMIAKQHEVMIAKQHGVMIAEQRLG